MQQKRVRVSSGMQRCLMHYTDATRSQFRQEPQTCSFCSSVHWLFSVFWGVFIVMQWRNLDTKRHKHTHKHTLFFPLCIPVCPHVIYHYTCLQHLPLLCCVCVCVCACVCVCVCVCETLRCAVSLTRYFHNTACLKPRGCIQVTPTGLSSGLRKARLVFCICWRARFHDLSNLQLTPLKVSYDLIETDYADNSITHNHVG